MPTGPQTINASDLSYGKSYKFTGDVVILGDIPASVDIAVYEGSLEVKGDIGESCYLGVDYAFSAHNIGRSSEVVAGTIHVKNDVRMQCVLTSCAHDVTIEGNVQPLCKIVSKNDVYINGEADDSLILEYEGQNYSKAKGTRTFPKVNDPAENQYDSRGHEGATLHVESKDLHPGTPFTSDRSSVVIHGDVPSGMTIDVKGDFHIKEGGIMGDGCIINAGGHVDVPNISSYSKVVCDRVDTDYVGMHAQVSTNDYLKVYGDVGAFSRLTVKGDLTIKGNVAKTAQLDFDGKYQHGLARTVLGKKDLGCGIIYRPPQGSFTIPPALLMDSEHNDFIDIMADVQEKAMIMREHQEQHGVYDRGIEIKTATTDSETPGEVRILTHHHLHAAQEIERSIVAYTQKFLGLSNGRD